MKTVLIIAVILVVAGLLIALGAFLAVGFDVRGFEKNEYTPVEYTVTDPFSDILVEADVHDLVLLPADGALRIVADEREDGSVRFSVSVAEGRLSVKLQDTRRWYQKIGIFGYRSPAVKIYLPAGVYGALQIVTDTGDASVAKELSFASASIETDTGDVRFAAGVAGKLDIEVDTGDALIENLTAGALSIESNTGDVEVRDVTVLAKLEIEVDTGDIELSRVTADTASLTSDTGDMDIEGLLLTGHLAIESDTGEVDIFRSDAASIFIETDTGDVSGRFLTDKSFIADSRTGRVRVPRTTGGRCEIRSSTGDIDFLENDD